MTRRGADFRRMVRRSLNCRQLARLRARVAAAACCCLASVSTAHAQRTLSPRGITVPTPNQTPTIGASVTANASALRSTSVMPGVDRSRLAPWWSPVASAVVPGAGQFALGQQRSVAYLVAELYLVVQAYAARRDFRLDRDEYRSLASDVARRPFGGTRPNGVWDYYELMEKYLESGVYSKSVSGTVVPETDTTTYNGASWLLARQNYWPNPNVAPATSSPEYQNALAEYSGRAIRDSYRWSWRDATLQQDLYRQTIAQANRRAQRAVNLAGLVGVNHLASMIDAYVTVRIRRFGGVRVAGLELDAIQSDVRAIGDPALGVREWRSSVRLVPTR